MQYLTAFRHVSLTRLFILAAFCTFVGAVSARAQAPDSRMPLSPQGAGRYIAADTVGDDRYWSDRFGGKIGFNGRINAIASGPGGLYVGGTFTSHAGIVSPLPEDRMEGVARWNGAAWEHSGDGLTRDITTVAYGGEDLYLAGFQNGSEGPVWTVSRKRGERWETIGAFDRPIYALAFSSTDLYVGGEFTSVDGVPVRGVARWTGGHWEPLGEGIKGKIFALAVDAGRVYAGGENQVLCWDGERWEMVGEAVKGYVSALAVEGGDLYVGGVVEAGGQPAYGVVRWDGQQWDSLQGGVAHAGGSTRMPGKVSGMAVFDGEVYVAGVFGLAGDLPTESSIAKWTGTGWELLKWTGRGQFTTLASDSTGVYAGRGVMWNSSLSEYWESSVIRWDGANWHGVEAQNGGMNDIVYALLADGASVYAGGDFTTAGGTWVSGVARWNGRHWEPLGDGVDGSVQAIAKIGSDIYVGGYFTKAGGKPARSIARWDGNEWHPLGTGVSAAVYALAASGSDLYAAGKFIEAGGVIVNRIAKWNGDAWEALGTGMNVDSLALYHTWVTTLAVSGSYLYAGGNFSTAGGIDTRAIARWDGSAWEAVSQEGWNWNWSGITALAADGSDVLAGGHDLGRVVVGRWNGAEWEAALALGAFALRVDALAVHDGTLYMGGRFVISHDDGPARSIAALAGDTLMTMGTGILHYAPENNSPGGEGTVYAMAVGANGEVFIGGAFRTAGGKSSNSFAVWHRTPESGTETSLPEAPEALRLDVPYPNPVRGVATITFSLSRPGPAYLEVYNPLGQRVAVLAGGHHPAGPTKALWETSRLPAGVYFVHLRADGTIRTRRVVVMK